MSDMVKGIIIGIILVKVYESDSVQNYIQKKVMEKCRNAGEALGRALYTPTKNHKDHSNSPVIGSIYYERVTLSNGDVIYIRKSDLDKVGVKPV